MNKRHENTFHSIRYTDGKYTHKKTVNDHQPLEKRKLKPQEISLYTYENGVMAKNSDTTKH